MSTGDPILDAAARIAAAGESRPRAARDPVNLPMIRNWTEALGGEGPAELDGADPDTAPPAMIQVWTMPGLPGVRADDDPLGQMVQVLDEAGYTSVVATNCDQTYHRYLKLGEQLSVRAALLDVTGPKRTALGEGWFVTTRSTWFSSGEPVATMDFRILKFRPSASPANPRQPRKPHQHYQPHAPADHPGHRVLGRHGSRRAAHPALRWLRRAAPSARADVPLVRASQRRRVRRRGRNRRGLQLCRAPSPAGAGQAAAHGRRARAAAGGRADGRRDARRPPGPGADRAAGARHVRAGRRGADAAGLEAV